jgi:ABC-type branched-subunit amino acid transport system ATPase component
MVAAAETKGTAVTETSTDAILSVRGVEKAFGGVRVLRGIDLDIPRGSIQGLIGPNGSGKSTFFDVLSGYQKPDTGSVAFNGQPVTGLEPHVVSRQGLIRTFQLTKVFMNLTVAENLLVFANGKTHEEREAAGDRVIETLDFVHLIGLADQEASVLSYGQLKLLELAQALMQQPKLLMLDEPFAGVNPGLIDELVAHLETLRQRGITILLVEHNLPIVAGVCDRIAVLHQGVLAVNDDPQVVVNDRDVKEVFLGEV